MWKKFLEKVADVFYTGEKLEDESCCTYNDNMCNCNDQCNCNNQCDNDCKCCK